jgi:hypothetical protein
MTDQVEKVLRQGDGKRQLKWREPRKVGKKARYVVVATGNCQDTKAYLHKVPSGMAVQGIEGFTHQLPKPTSRSSKKSIFLSLFIILIIDKN